MRNKKLISLLFGVCISLLIATVGILSIFAATQPTVYADSINANAGQMVRIPILISNNSGLAGAKLQFSYDETKLTPISVESGDVFSSGLQDNIEGDAQPGLFNVYWASATGDNVSADGVLFYINFNVESSAYGSSVLGVSYDKADTFDEDFNDVSLKCEDVNIEISNESLANKTKITTSAELYNDKFVDVTFHITNVGELDNLDLNIGYDDTAFSYDSILGNANITSNNAGVLKFNTYISSSDNDTDYITVRFQINQEAKTGNYIFNITSDSQNVICENCEISITTPNISQAANVYIPAGIVAEKGQSVTVPVMINNNQGIMGYRLSFTYNTSDLQIVSVSNVEEFYGNISDSIGNEDGSFDVVWNSTENKTSNSTLLYLNFDVVSTTVDQAVESQIQINYTSGDTFNENYEDVELNCTNGTVVICPGHTYTKTVVNPSCTETGYSSFECNYCSTQYFDEYTEPIGHYYIYQGNKSYISNISYTMDYRCKDCDELYSTNGDEVLNIWSNNTDKYINSRPSRNDLYSQLIDVNNDNFINAKDYAMIYHAHKAK